MPIRAHLSCYSRPERDSITKEIQQLFVAEDNDYFT